MAKKTRKGTRGGARPGAGRPVTTGARETNPVFFRVSTTDLAHAKALAAADGQTVNAFAKATLLDRIGGRRGESKSRSDG